jgi:hypothetical protein
MRTLLFLARLAVLCNVCFAITFLLHMLPALQQGVILSTFLVMGNILAIVFNVLFHVICLVMLLIRNPVSAAIPKWMIIFNFLFLVAQVILLIR